MSSLSDRDAQSDEHSAIIAFLQRSADHYRAKGEVMDAAMVLGIKAYIERLRRGNDHCNHLTDQNRLMIILLAHIRETIDNFVDVDDGDYGAPKPNWAMQLTTEINTLIGED